MNGIIIEKILRLTEKAVNKDSRKTLLKLIFLIHFKKK